MYKNCTARRKSILDEASSRWEVLKQVLVLDIIDFDNHMLVPLEQLLFQRKSQHR
jgi:hypothetical protein